MGTFHSFEEIDVWQESRRLIKAVRAMCKRPHVKNDFSFIDQITRASRSVSANIAEGNDAMTISEFINYLGFSKRSCAEVCSHLYDALDEGYISAKEHSDLSEITKKICRMLASLIHYLQSLDPSRKRTELI